MSRAKLLRRARWILRTAITSTGKRAPFLRQLVRSGAIARRARDYARRCGAVPVDPSVVVFESYAGRSYSCSPRAISETMRAEGRTAGYEQIWAVSRANAVALHELGGFDVHGLDFADPRELAEHHVEFAPDALEHLRRVRIVVHGSREYYRDFARAGLWVTNFRMPAELIPREGQTFIQTWHGTPLKRLGCDIEDGVWASSTHSQSEWRHLYGLEGRRLTYLLAGSPFAAEALASAFDLTQTGRADAVLQLGYPRNDYLTTFTSQQVAATKKRLGVPEGNRVVLYAPTWRDDRHTAGEGYTYEIELDFDRLRAQLGDGYTVLFRAHYLIANSFDFERFSGFVIDASRVNDINDLYVISDVLVTDYSSVFFDYANLLRPIVFYMYDLDRYANEIHGFYFGLDELPGPIVQTQDDLAEAIHAAESPTDKEITRVAAFGQAYAPHDDGYAAERVVRRAVAPLTPHPLSDDEPSGKQTGEPRVFSNAPAQPPQEDA